MRVKRLMAALAVALMCAPGTFVRTDIVGGMPRDIALEQVSGPSGTANPVWQLEGVWRFSADHLYFGGYSALLALDDHTLRAFSDRGTQFTFVDPASGTPALEKPSISGQVVPERYVGELRDIESATRDPDTGHYWLGFEALHAILRYTEADKPRGLRLLEDEVDWPDNSGAEAMLRLADGRFMVIPEGGAQGLLYPSDPVEGAKAEPFRFRSPVESFAATDLAQLPDGRVLIVMRNAIVGIPPFEALLALGPAPRAGETWAPQVVLDLDGPIPRENYEGLAVHALDDGRAAVWLIADDNMSLMQRTLLVKLLYDPVERTPEGGSG